MAKYTYESLLFNTVKEQINKIQYWPNDQEITLNTFVPCHDIEFVFQYLLKQTKMDKYFYGKNNSKYNTVLQYSFYRKPVSAPLHKIIHVFESMFREQLAKKYPVQTTRKTTPKTKKQTTTVLSQSMQEKLVQVATENKVIIVIMPQYNTVR